MTTSSVSVLVPESNCLKFHWRVLLPDIWWGCFNHHCIALTYEIFISTSRRLKRHWGAELSDVDFKSSLRYFCTSVRQVHSSVKHFVFKSWCYNPWWSVLFLYLNLDIWKIIELWYWKLCFKNNIFCYVTPCESCKRATRRHIQEDGILHSHRRENFKSFMILQVLLRCFLAKSMKFLIYCVFATEWCVLLKRLQCFDVSQMININLGHIFNLLHFTHYSSSEVVIQHTSLLIYPLNHNFSEIIIACVYQSFFLFSFANLQSTLQWSNKYICCGLTFVRKNHPVMILLYTL
jgi:hypothetical protein